MALTWGGAEAPKLLCRSLATLLLELRQHRVGTVGKLTAERARRAEVEMANARMHVALEDERQRVRQAQQQLAATEAELQRCRQALHEQETRIAQMQQGADGFAGGGACAEAVPQVCQYCKQALPPSGQRKCPVRVTVANPRAPKSLTRVAPMHQRRQRCMRARYVHDRNNVLNVQHN